MKDTFIEWCDSTVNPTGFRVEFHSDGDEMVDLRTAHKKGGDWSEWSGELRVRQLPELP